MTIVYVARSRGHCSGDGLHQAPGISYQEIDYVTHHVLAHIGEKQTYVHNTKKTLFLNAINTSRICYLSTHHALPYIRYHVITIHNALHAGVG